MRVRNLERTWEGLSSEFNTCGGGEVIVCLLNKDGVFEGQDSAFISELEVYIDSTEEWKNMNEAFKDKDIISDKCNTCFREPLTEEERQQGHF